MRGICIVLLEVWWAIGSVFAALLALGVIPNSERILSYDYHVMNAISMQYPDLYIGVYILLCVHFHLHWF